MIEIADREILPEIVIKETKTPDSGCVATYVGLIRDTNKGKAVQSVHYSDPDGKAIEGLKSIVRDAMDKWPLNKMSMVHRIGKLSVGDINLVIAVAAGHRAEAIEACSFAVDEFKSRLPTVKLETYPDGTASSVF